MCNIIIKRIIGSKLKIKIRKWSIMKRKSYSKPQGKGNTQHSKQTSKDRKNLERKFESKPRTDNKPITDNRQKTVKKSTAPCPYFIKCGGCQLQEKSYLETLADKNLKMQNLLSDFGDVKPIIGMDNPWHYRNKSHSTFAYDKREGNRYGLYEASSHKLIKIDRCLIQDEKADQIVADIHKLMPSFKMTAYNENSGMGFLRHVLIKIGKQSKQIMVVLIVTNIIFPGKKNFVKALRDKHPEITTIIQNINDEQTTMVLGRREIVLYGKGYIEDVLCGLTFQISAKSFYQINPIQTEILYKIAMSYAKLSGQEVVLDAYCGIGTIGLIASKEAREVIGVELNPDAVSDAIKNAKANQIKNAKFYTGDAGAFMIGMANEQMSLDVVFLDPPRSGTTEAFVRAVAKAKAKRVVYVSCGPETLARDLTWFKETGYDIIEIQPVDMFPWTEHVETCLLLKRI